MEMSIENLERMTSAEASEFWAQFEAQLDHDDGQAAKAMLAAGIPIYYREADTPGDLLVKEYPDGRRELVDFAESGERFVRVIG